MVFERTTVLRATIAVECASLETKTVTMEHSLAGFTSLLLVQEDLPRAIFPREWRQRLHVWVTARQIRLQLPV
jgi:hypothetical protein